MVNQSPAETALSSAMIRWSLSKATPALETPTSCLYRVEQNGRNIAALKLIKPNAGDAEKRGGALLAWYAGEGAVTVFDSTDNAVFMEWVDGVTLATPSRGGKDDEAAIAISTLVQHLHRPREGAPGGLTPLRERFEVLFNTSARIWPNTARDLFARSVGIGLGMFDKPTAIIPLHGDLHHGNILLSDRGWLAIDPKGLLGDPAYELANVFINPPGVEKLVANPGRVNRLADMFADRLKMNRRRILGWAASHAALTACWDIADGKNITLQLAVLPHLLAAYDAA